MKSTHTIPCNLIRDNHTIYDPLDRIQHCLQEYKLANPAMKSKSPELRLLKSLKNEYPQVIFKASDKNLGLVALNLDHYDRLVMEHLANVTNYELVADNILTKDMVQQRIHTKYRQLTVDSYQNDQYYPFDRHERKFLQKQGNFTFPKFHCLPKIHKAGPLKGRPIAGAVNWFTTPISRILDLRLQRLLHQEQFSCILRNSQQLVEELQLANSHLPVDRTNFYFITGDVQSLYPNIDINRLQTITTELDFMLEPLVKFVCDHSYVEYAGRIYRQLNGIAMGTNAAVNLANIYMAYVVDQYISSRRHVFYYKRYIDDLFIIWTGTKEEWTQLASNINRLHPTINIDFVDPSPDYVNFLDVTVSFCNFTQKIDTRIYQKELNKYLYITPESCHVPHMFSGFVKGELTRYARLSSNVFTYQIMKKLFYERLANRGYSRLFLNRIFSKHHWTLRFEDRHQRLFNPILPFVVRYSKRNDFGSVEKLFHNMSHAFDDFFIHPKLMLVYSRSANTNDLLTSSALNRTQIELLEEH